MYSCEGKGSFGRRVPSKKKKEDTSSKIRSGQESIFLLEKETGKVYFGRWNEKYQCYDAGSYTRGSGCSGYSFQIWTYEGNCFMEISQEDADQRPEVRSENLMGTGYQWFGEVQLAEHPDRGGTIERFDALKTEFTLGRGWQPRDPVIRPSSGKPRSYNDLVAIFERNPIGYAQEFLGFLNNESSLAELSREVQEFAVITHVAEVGRGYGKTSLKKLGVFMEKIIAGTSRWSDIKKEYFPSLTYKEDARDWYE